MNKQECLLVDRGLLIKGLRTAIVSIALKSNDLITFWD